MLISDLMELLRKKITKKSLENQFFKSNFFGAFFLNNFFRSEISIKFRIYDTHIDLFWEKKFSLWNGLFIFIFFTGKYYTRIAVTENKIQIFSILVLGF
jgi:hypothetical protein